jgi:membrane protease YdiL (CAAX protease family)
MNTLQGRMLSHPLLTILILILLSLGAFSLESQIILETHFEREMLHSSNQILLSLILLALLYKGNQLKAVGFSVPFREWHPNWWRAAIPISLIGIINLLSINWPLITFDGVRIAGWLFNNLTTGVFEELLLRGICFHLIYTAWKHRKNGLIKAALAQALIFGIAHLVNLKENPTIDVAAQVIYATLLGIGFAGIVAYSKSLWPAIGIHSIINAMGDINGLFIDGYVASSGNAANYAVAIIVIFLVATLPGLYMLRQAQRNQPTR